MRVRTAAVGVSVALTLGAAVTGAVVGRGPTGPGGPAAVAAAQAVPPAPVAASRTRPQPTALTEVAPLRTLRVPDLLVTVRRSLTGRQLAALRSIRGLQGLTVLDVGTVRLGPGKGVRIAGVDPSQFRQFTPRQTAVSDPLWQAVARSEVAPTYGVVRSRGLTLGGTVTLQGLRPQASRVGAAAVFGVPGVDVVTSRSAARSLGVVPASAVLLNAPDRGLEALKRAVVDIVGSGAVVAELRPRQVSPNRPKTYRELYIDSAKYCPGLPWQLLAAIGQVESGHGRNVGPSTAGALGPMQFLPSTWAFAGVDGDGDGKADIMNPYDAVPAAALYLCRAGATQGPQGLYDAVFSYNHAEWYVREVLALADKYK